MSQSLHLTRLPALPAGFVSVRDILDGKCGISSKVNIVGLVVDFRTPVPTRKEDWKCQIKFYDSSVEENPDDSMSFDIFRAKDDMPHVTRGDVILILQAKVQKYHGGQSLSILTTFGTDIYIYESRKIPHPPKDVSVALNTHGKVPTAKLNKAVNDYVCSMYQEIDKSRVPTEAEFEVLKVQSTNMKDKFRELKDVRDGGFCDIIAQIIKRPYDVGDRITLWVSDYTENSGFYHYAFQGNNTESPDGDAYGYTTKFHSDTPAQTGWPGPFGKKSIQITCYEPHATAVRSSQMTSGTWVSIRNLQIKYGQNATNLEGFLREDRAAWGVKLGIFAMDLSEDPENMDPRLKDALRRKRDTERAKKQQLKSVTEAVKAGQKRKAAGVAPEPKNNSKARRKAGRANLSRNAGQHEAPSASAANSNPQDANSDSLKPTNLNPHVKCESQNKPTSSVSEMLECVSHNTTIDGQSIKLQLPFVNINHRANVRIVDFLPARLEDFAVPKKKKNSEYAALSDNEEDSDSGSDPEQETAEVQEWEWRFSLELVDACDADGQRKNSMWVVVDNPTAQYLLNQDASDLRRNQKALETLRQQMFILWGELEEQKTRKVAWEQRAERAAKKDGPPVHSDEEDADKPEDTLPNRPFSCCIRQYGVKVDEADPAMATAGDGKRWQRMFGLFGTRLPAV